MVIFLSVKYVNMGNVGGVYGIMNYIIYNEVL